MKSQIVALMLVLATFACQSHSGDRLTSSEYFSRFSSLAEALRIYPGLMITGSGSQTKIILRKNTGVQNQEPLYVLNGFPLGTNYNQTNQAINMADVTNIRLLSQPSELTTYGSMASAGVIEIKTRIGGK